MPRSGRWPRAATSPGWPDLSTGQSAHTAHGPCPSRPGRTRAAQAGSAQPTGSWRDRDLAALGRQRDVGTVARTLELDPGNRSVCALARLGEISAGGHHGQDAPTRGHECAVLFDGRARMKDICIVTDIRHALNEVATAGRARVPLGGHDDGHSVLRTPAERSDLVKLADSRRIQQAAKRGGLLY